MPGASCCETVMLYFLHAWWAAGSDTHTRFDWQLLVARFGYIVFLVRSVRLIVNLYASRKQRQRLEPIPARPRFSSGDVTVIVPTICNYLHELRSTISSIVTNAPRRVLIVTTAEKFKAVSELAQDICRQYDRPDSIMVYKSQIRNKRFQMCRALRKVQTPFVLFADDDVTLPRQTLQYLLAPFEENEKMGGVGTSQRVRRGVDDWNVWRFLGYQYIERRNFDCGAGVYVDGGLPCLSGRCVLYRASIVTQQSFMYGFTHEMWRSPFSFKSKMTPLIHADDDNFLTRWLVKNGWDITIQMHADCTVETTLEVGWNFISQCLRWSRSNWRSNYTSLVKDDWVIWSRHPWSVFAFFLTTFTDFALARDTLQCWTVYYVTDVLEDQWLKATVRALLWFYVLAFVKIVKFDFHRRPGDLKYVPAMILWGWVHSVIIKVWALFTINQTSWGSREGADSDNAFRLLRVPSNHTEKAALSTSAYDLKDPIMTALLEHEKDDDTDDVYYPHNVAREFRRIELPLYTSLENGV